MKFRRHSPIKELWIWIKKRLLDIKKTLQLVTLYKHNRDRDKSFLNLLTKNPLQRDAYSVVLAASII